MALYLEGATESHILLLGSMPLNLQASVGFLMSSLLAPHSSCDISPIFYRFFFLFEITS